MTSPAKPEQSKTADSALLPSDAISLAVPAAGDTTRPPAIRYMSSPAYQSPLRHHRRAASSTKRVKETLNAHSEYSNSEDDGGAIHRINQYTIKQEIGRGSFGAVHLGIDQFGKEYAVKEFSKSRLRKRAQSHLLRRPNAPRRSGQWAAGLGFNSPLHRHSSSDVRDDTTNNPLDLIKEEIAIMKKLNHNNLVALIEVLDDPEEDSLYMVMEMCKKGVVMKVGLEERSDPYDEESCRCWFRDMILGIEYLHAQGILHRDIKPDNCLITEDDVLKVVDFGVSEMFEKHEDMSTAKSAGSPAFMPPELCVAKHGAVSGKAADLWSMGVTLYCLRFGRIPFEKTNIMELYDSIRGDELDFDGEVGGNLKDLIHRILEKDPQKRITMEDLRKHPWVTKSGTDPLLSAEENTADIVEPPTEVEMKNAITGKMGNLMTVMKAVKRFKNLIIKKRPELLEGILGRGSRIVQPPLSIKSPTMNRYKTRSVDLDNRRPVERVLAAEGVHHAIEISDDVRRLPERMDSCILETDDVGHSSAEPLSSGASALQKAESAAHHPHGEHKATELHHRTFSDGKGHAHDPLTDTLYLDIGTGIEDGPPNEGGKHIISESPSAVEMNVYEMAYQEEVDRILKARGRAATMYLTRRVEHKKELREHQNIIDHSRDHHSTSVGSGLSKLVAKAQERAQARDQEQQGHGGDSVGAQSGGEVGEKRPEMIGPGNVLAKMKGFEDKASDGDW
ncbi:MAG: hypothetical protein M1822_002190 [Bathelium mastoideum]|nr:MAG: hypothetical protein M1822_002190 [Bathelium mastoideum]